MKVFWHTLLALLCLVDSAGVQAEESVSEARLKAGFIANFIQFVRWPHPPVPLVLCSLGTERSRELREEFAGISARYPALVMRWVRAASALDGCHAVYVTAEQGSELPAVLAATAGRPVLVIADLDGGAPLGAMLSLVSVGGDRLGFDANLSAARAAGLSMNARLLQLARRVY